MMKKYLALLLVVVMILGCFVGCNQTPPEDTKGTTPPATKPTEVVVPTQPTETNPTLGQLPLVTEKTTITIGIPAKAITEDYETNDYTLWLQEQTGIELDFVLFSDDSTEMVTQLNLMVSGKEKLPDILWGFSGVSAALRNELGADEYLVDLKDYFSEYGYWFWDAYNQIPDYAQEYLFQYGVDPASGALYAFPCYQQSGGDQLNTKSYINAKWLEAVGEDVPTTVEELYTVLKKFATEDPNGNGKADEMALLGSDTRYRCDIVEFIINAFVYCCDANLYNATDGKVWVPYTTDEYRQAMIFLNKLYAEGLLTPLFYSINDNAELKSLVTPADGVALGGVVGAHDTVFWEKDNPIIYEYVALPPLKAATSLGGYAPMTGDSYEYNTFITTDAADPVLCFKLLDFMCGTESFFHMRYGTEGVHWKYYEGEGGTSSLGYPAVIEALDSQAYSTQNNVNWHQIRGVVTCYAANATLSVLDDSWTGTRSKMAQSLYQAYINSPRPDEVITKLIYNAEENEVASELKSSIKSYVDEARAMFVSGVMDPNDDAQWNAYLANLEAQGLGRLLEVVQSAYTRMTAE